MSIPCVADQEMLDRLQAAVDKIPESQRRYSPTKTGDLLAGGEKIASKLKAPHLGFGVLADPEAVQTLLRTISLLQKTERHTQNTTGFISFDSIEQRDSFLEEAQRLGFQGTWVKGLLEPSLVVPSVNRTEIQSLMDRFGASWVDDVQFAPLDLNEKP